ncbi:MAG TPA: hypothetical protein PK331_09160 [Gordonia sp. (in: high G+C Gram-positive bacteria)]|uniref:hypothetical protein n=1 Tax=unclassified Gordonia (in: high G+C Gram-positive bacteria) TaxID=2657482 RepID=UPI000FA0FFEB|nr:MULTISPECIES: hypothetical protein [unclassified Gordonia (in: high G+C Gram-positive bacteria)]RUP37272.1 MAG: hypothetical protein EKK60_13105 [Gordonia sp. (in: high G+C Gram-positive bacteria)]HNP57539.1 hypothetical protein [Gordonia sp. (in: high G+C Gram-positive bacteria)]HRC51076.1 hypothetical protein [Gordonia sp. (in: high G+C Gram-positive bacteria)]
MSSRVPPAPSTADIRRWTEAAQVPGPHRELSDSAAIMIASGFVTPEARTVIVARQSRGLPLATLPTGFGDLRRLQRGISQLEAQLANPVLPTMVRSGMQNRLNGLIRRREDARKQIVLGKGVYAGGTRAIRRERREGVYLEIEARERLFDGLLHTPTPDVNTGGYVRRAGGAAFGKLAGFVGGLAVRAMGQQVESWAREALTPRPMPAAPAAPQQMAFIDGYETLLYVVGAYYDRIQASPSWRSEHFEVQRSQINLHADVADVAADIIALRSVRVDLDRAMRNGGFDQQFVDHIAAKEQDLRPVWTQLLERVQALAEVAHVMDSAAVELRLIDEYDRATTIDDRIVELVSRSGSREISADNSQRLTQQVRAGEEQLRIYRDVLAGNIARLSPVDAMGKPLELPERYEPSQPLDHDAR